MGANPNNFPMPRSPQTPVRACTTSAYTIPTDRPESDGTLQWDSTTLVLVELEAGGATGIGYTYADAATARLIDDSLKDEVLYTDPFATAKTWAAMVKKLRNAGRPGLSSCAVAAVDVALHDLVGKLLDQPTHRLLGPARDAVDIYGSGGFTSYTIEELKAQLAGWVDQGIGRVKMKVGRDPAADPARTAAARDAIGPDAELFVDANGAYAPKQALALARQFADLGVTWFEQPVYHFDLAGLRLVRDRVPPPMEVTSGEYGYTPFDFKRLLDAGAVDVLQIDATRCGGYTAFLRAAAVAEAHCIPISSHCAPALHLPVCCCAPGVRHMEYFHDHARIERLLFDGPRDPAGGQLAPDPEKPGIGLHFKRSDAEQFRVA